MNLLNSQFSILKSQFSKRGFTMAELIITVSIIAILVTAGVFTYNGSLKAARDNQRIADMNAIRTALELFYREKGRYPDNEHENIPVTGQYIGVGETIDHFLDDYMVQVPKDPLHDPSENSSADGIDTEYFYSYDPLHSQSNDSGCYIDDPDCDCDYIVGNTRTVIGFKKAEVLKNDNLRKDTCAGTNMELNVSDYVLVVGY